MIRGRTVRISEPVASYLLNLLRQELAARAPCYGTEGDESPESEVMRAAVNDLANGIQAEKHEAAVLAENDDKRAAEEEARRAGRVTSESREQALLDAPNWEYRKPAVIGAIYRCPRIVSYNPNSIDGLDKTKYCVREIDHKGPCSTEGE